VLPEGRWPRSKNNSDGSHFPRAGTWETEALKQKAGVGSRYRLREKYVNQQFYGSGANELRKVVEIEWVGARPVTIPKKDWCQQWACVTDLLAGGGDLEEAGGGHTS
jgi:hypothetical protein